MTIISQISIDRTGGNSTIQLIHGDLSNIPPEHESDILIMSAFPNNYIALKGSLILALEQKGLSVKKMAAEKETDLREQLSCWLSKPLSTKEQAMFHFRRLLCFEPGNKIKEPGEVVGNIFRCINTFAFDEGNNVVIMPIIGTGYQRVPVDKMLPELLQTAVFWLQNGLPLSCIKLVVFRENDLQEAVNIFESFRSSIQKPATPAAKAGEVTKNNLPDVIPPPQPVQQNFQYDYFLSYAHTHAAEVAHFVAQLKKANKELSIFYDRDSIPAGGMWIQMISAAIENAKKVLVFLSPDYDKSPVCWDEFQCAKLMEYTKKKSIIQTIYLFGHGETPMPLIMGIYSYIDCREGDIKKISDCIQQLTK